MWGQVSLGGFFFHMTFFKHPIKYLRPQASSETTLMPGLKPCDSWKAKTSAVKVSMHAVAERAEDILFTKGRSTSTL